MGKSIYGNSKKQHFQILLLRLYLSNCEDFSWNEKDSVETNDRKILYKANRNDVDRDFSIDNKGNIKIYSTFNLTKFDATNKIKVHLFKSNGEEVIIELEKYLNYIRTK